MARHDEGTHGDLALYLLLDLDKTVDFCRILAPSSPFALRSFCLEGGSGHLGYNVLLVTMYCYGITLVNMTFLCIVFQVFG